MPSPVYFMMRNTVGDLHHALEEGMEWEAESGIDEFLATQRRVVRRLVAVAALI